MADVTITIPFPILVSPEKFKTRYRALPSGSFSANVDRTNAPFTLTGLAVGFYELEIIFVKANGDECATSLQPFQVVETFACIDFSASIQKDSSGNFYLLVNYSTPSNPPCGWQAIYTINNVTTTVNYATLTGNHINIPIPSNNTVHLIMRANLCNGKSMDCFTGDVAPISSPCIPMILTQVELLYNGPASSLPNSYFIRIKAINSNPATPNYIINYQETSPTGPYPPDHGTFNYTGATLLPGGTAFLFSFQVFPETIYNNNSGIDLPNYGACIQYKGSIVDICGVSHPFCVALPVGCLSCFD